MTAKPYQMIMKRFHLSLMAFLVASLTGISAQEATTTLDLTDNTEAPLKLPFADSFAGASFGDVWTAEILVGNYNWEALSSSSKTPKVSESYDNDGGFAFYNAFDAPEGNSARLYTAPIEHTAGAQPIAEFYVYLHKQSDTLKLQVKCDDGDWTDVPGAQLTMNQAPEGWTKFQFPIASVIADDCTTFRLAFVVESNYGFCVLLDKVRIYAPANKDLEATLTSAPSTVVAGNDIKLDFAVTNNSMSDVSAADYSLSLVTDFPNTIEQPESTDIPAGAEKQISVTIPVSAAETLPATYSFALKVDYEGDELPDNNTSASATVELTFANKDVPSNPKATQQDDGSIKLTWEYATPEALNVGTSFENFEDGFTGPFDGFTSIDLDKVAGDDYCKATGSAFNVINSPIIRGADGNGVIGVTLDGNRQQDDWLISPKLNCQEGNTMDLSFLIAMRKFSVISSNRYTFEVLYTTDDTYDPLAPSMKFTKRVVMRETDSPNYSDFYMQELFYTLSVRDIPAEAKYIALHFISKISYSSALWLDNIKIQENITDKLLGFNVYEKGVGRVNDSVIGPSDREFTIPDTNLKRQRYFITAVYERGESAPSSLTGQVITSVGTVEHSALSVYTTAQGITVEGTDGAKVTVYNIGGRAVASSVGDATFSLAPDIYIVRAGADARKVIVPATR